MRLPTFYRQGIGGVVPAKVQGDAPKRLDAKLVRLAVKDDPTAA